LTKHGLTASLLPHAARSGVRYPNIEGGKMNLFILGLMATLAHAAPATPEAETQSEPVEAQPTAELESTGTQPTKAELMEINTVLSTPVFNPIEERWTTGDNQLIKSRLEGYTCGQRSAVRSLVLAKAGYSSDNYATDELLQGMNIVGVRVTNLKPAKWNLIALASSDHECDVKLFTHLKPFTLASTTP
jgi:hypothetical protein